MGRMVLTYMSLVFCLVMIGCQAEPAPSTSSGTKKNTSEDLEVCQFHRANKVYDASDCDLVEFTSGSSSDEESDSPDEGELHDELPDENESDDAEDEVIEEDIDNKRVTYNDSIKQLLDDECIQCHNGGENGLSDLRSYDAAVLAAEDALGWIESGDMPKNGDKLSQDKIDRFKDWVSEGAPEK